MIIVKIYFTVSNIVRTIVHALTIRLFIMKNFTSKIATIVYKEYTENVDMNNEYFKQSELNKLIKTDKSIVRVDYYIDGVLVGNTMYTGKQAMSQIVKMNTTQAKIYDKMEGEYGHNWFECKARNEKRSADISALYDKMIFYKRFITEEDFNECDEDFCMTYEEFVN